MTQSRQLKLVVYAPLSHANIVRSALGDAGAGQLGNYDHCSFSSRGTGRYQGNAQSKPLIGGPEQFEAAEEERIEVTIPRERMHDIVAAMREVHPYDEVAFDLYALEDFMNDTAFISRA